MDTAKADARASSLGHNMEWVKAGRRYLGDCKKCGRPAMVSGHDCLGSALLVTCQRVRKP